MIPTLINGNWTLNLPEHRAARPQWVTGWERERLDAMHATIKPGDVIYDIGAEEGDFSALFATWAGPSGGVCLFEPNPRVWPNIRAIFEGNNLPRPKGWWVGFAGHETEEKPPLSDVDAAPLEGWPICAYGPIIGDHGFRSYHDERARTPTITLDAFSQRIDVVPNVITMDVEGSEWFVLAGAKHLLQLVRPIVFASLHPQFMHDLYGLSNENVLELMRGYGYAAEHIATDHEEHWCFTPHSS